MTRYLDTACPLCCGSGINGGECPLCRGDGLWREDCATCSGRGEVLGAVVSNVFSAWWKGVRRGRREVVKCPTCLGRRVKAEPGGVPPWRQGRTAPLETDAPAVPPERTPGSVTT